jgi:phospholipid/cholesterol/gamma-HCH transport system permease protein
MRPNLAQNIKKTVVLKSSVSMNQFQTLLINVADWWLFLLRFFKELFHLPFEFNEFVRQGYKIGNKSLGLVTINGFIMGLVLTIQSKPTLADFGAESWLPGMVAISIVREIGPVITALICAGKVGSGIGAELGSMRVTEQIDAMEVSGTHPFRFLVVTRILATSIIVPILVFYSDFVGILGSYVGANIDGDVTLQLFLMQATSSLEFSDLIPATIKSVFFGLVIGLAGCYKGYNANKGTESVGVAANEAVVAASLLVFLVDLIAVQFTNIIL